MKNFDLTKLMCLLGLVFFSHNVISQCNFNCPTNGNFSGTATVMTAVGDPCVYIIEWTANGTSGGPTGASMLFTNAICTDCPAINTDGVSVTTWTIASTIENASPDEVSFDYIPPLSSHCNMGEQTCILKAAIVVPVEMFYFNAEMVNQNTQLHWSTASELNNAGFEIEHSVNGRFWNNIGFVEGLGYSQENQQYSFAHKSPTDGNNYYRLKQLDNNGQINYSQVVSINYEKELEGFSMFPNPTASNQSLFIQLEKGLNGTMIMFDFTGQQIMSIPTEQIHNQSISLENLKPGIYLVSLKNQNKQYTKRLVVQ